MEGKQITFAEGLTALATVLGKLESEIAHKSFEEFEQEEDRAEIACERCAYWPCICGDPEFEQWNTEELNRAQEVD